METNYTNTDTKSSGVNKYFILFALISIVTIWFLVNEVKKRQSLDSSADNYTAQLSFNVPSVQAFTGVPNTVQIWANTTGPVGFVSFDVNFDPSLVQMSQDLVLTDTNLTRIVQMTQLTEANSTGRMTVVIGLDPSRRSSAPSGPFRLGDITFLPLSLNPNQSSQVGLSTRSIVATDSSIMATTSTGLQLMLNPTATQAPSQTTAGKPTVTPRPTTITNPTITPQPTPTPTRRGRGGGNNN